MERVYNFLKAAKIYYLATVDGDQPRVRPFGSAHIFEGKIYIHTGKTKDVTKQILANNKVEISTMYKNEWIRIACNLVLDERVEAQDSVLDSMPGFRSKYTTGPEGNTAVFYIENATATISSFTKEPVVIEF